MPPGKFETERVRDFKMSVYLGKFELFHPKTYFVPQKFRIAQQKINLVCKKNQVCILFLIKMKFYSAISKELGSPGLDFLEV